MTDWTIRHYDERDAPGIRYLWIIAYSTTPQGRVMSALHGISAAEAMWREHRPIVDRLMAHSSIICDPERPEVIWAFACTERLYPQVPNGGQETAIEMPFPVLHMAVVKSKFVEYRVEMLNALIGDLRGRKVRYTHVIPDVTKAWGGNGMGGMPEAWTFDPYWLARER